MRLFVMLLPLILISVIFLLEVRFARPHAQRFRHWLLPTLVGLALLATVGLVLGGTPKTPAILSVLLLWLVVLGKTYQSVHSHS